MKTAMMMFVVLTLAANALAETTPEPPPNKTTIERSPLAKKLVNMSAAQLAKLNEGKRCAK